MVEALLRFAGRLWDEVCAGWDLLRGLLSGLGERLRSLVMLVKNLASEAVSYTHLTLPTSDLV